MWHGAVEGAVWAEGPHLYRRAGDVLLLASEGGTERHHAVSAARGASPTGPFTGSRANPLLTHRHLGGDATVANVGHADLVDDGRGGWWATVLATRRLPLDGTPRRRAAGPRDLARPGRLRGRVAGVRTGDRPVGRGGRGAVGGSAVDRREDAGRRLRRADAASGTAVGSHRARAQPGAARRTAGAPPPPRRLRQPPRARTARVRGLPPRAARRDALDGGRGTGCPVARPARRAGAAALRAPTRHPRRARGHGRPPRRRTRAPRRRRGPRAGRRRRTRGRLGLALEIDGFEAVARVEYGERREIAVGSADLSPLSPSEGGGFVGVVGGVFVVGEPARDGPGTLTVRRPGPTSTCSAWCTRRRADRPSRGGATGAKHQLRARVRGRGRPGRLRRRRRALAHDEARGEVHAGRGRRPVRAVAASSPSCSSARRIASLAASSPMRRRGWCTVVSRGVSQRASGMSS